MRYHRHLEDFLQEKLTREREEFRDTKRQRQRRETSSANKPAEVVIESNERDSHFFRAFERQPL